MMGVGANVIKWRTIIEEKIRDILYSLRSGNLANIPGLGFAETWFHVCS